MKSKKELLETIHDIEIKAKKVNDMRPINKIALSKMRDELNIKSISNSLNIEGIHITARETRLLLNGSAIKNNDFKDKTATINLGFTFNYLEQNLNKKVNIDFINELHYRIMSGLLPIQDCGKLRNGEVRITESNHIPPSHSKVSTLLNKAFDEYYSNIFDEHVLFRIFKLKHAITNIHPYFDGNGRVSRLVMQYLLLQNRYIPSIIHDKESYYETLEYADLYLEWRPFFEVMLNDLNQTYDEYIQRIINL